MTTQKLRAGHYLSLSPVPVLVGIVVVAALLRIFKLGALGIIADENISILAIEGTLEHGYPLLPSGMIYLRLGWFGYVVAAFGHVFGTDEFWLRLPAVLFSVGLIPVAYLFVSRLFSKPVGLIVAALIAVAPAEIEIARLVRMYAPFAFFYLLTTLFIYRRYVDHSTTSSAVPLALALISVVTHQLGFSLAIVFLVPLLARRQSRADVFRLLASSAATGAFFVAWDATIAHYMTIHVPPQVSADAVPAASALAAALGPLLKILGQLAVPPFAFVTELVRSGSVALFSAAAVLLVVTGGAIVALHRLERPAVIAAALACIAACALQQMNIAVILLLLYLAMAGRGVQPLASRGGLALLAAIGVWFGAWLAFAYYFTEPNAVAAAGISTHLRQSIRTLLDFPQYNVTWGLFFEMPAASIVAVLGMLWCIDGAARRNSDAPRAFLLYAFVLPVIVSGSVYTTFRELRYVMHFDVLFLTFIALGILHWRSVLEALGLMPARAVRSVLALRAGTVAMAVLAFAYIPGPASAWINVNREHGVAQGIAAAFKLPFHPDYRTPAAYVLAHRDAAREPLITMQPREFYPYVPDVDYWLTSHEFEIAEHAYAIDGERRDLYVDVPIISSMKQLKAVLAASPGAVWLVAPDSVVASGSALTDDLTAFIDSLDEQIVYTGLDGDMRVYRLEHLGH
jgi:hypothetical protein